MRGYKMRLRVTRTHVRENLVLVVGLRLDAGRIRKRVERSQVGESEEVPSLRIVGGRAPGTTSCGEGRRVENVHELYKVLLESWNE